MEKRNINHTGLNGNHNKGESQIFILYDIESNKIRKKIFIACEDYGLKSIQFSIFYGSLSNNKYEELFLKLKKIAGDQSNNIILIPVCMADFKKILINGEKLSMHQTNFMEMV
jgi:CRISPR-associated protein Cas2